MTFLKIASLAIVTQGLAGSLLSALVVGSSVGEPFILLRAGLASLAYLFVTGALGSLLPSLLLGGALSLLVGRTTWAGSPMQCVVGAALGSGLLWAVLGAALGRLLISDRYLMEMVSASVLSGVISGGLVGWYALRLKQRNRVARQAHA